MSKGKKSNEDTEFEPEKTKATQVRFPVALYEKIQERAKKGYRSFNGEVVYCLEHYFNLSETLLWRYRHKAATELDKLNAEVKEYATRHNIHFVEAMLTLGLEEAGEKLSAEIEALDNPPPLK